MLFLIADKLHHDADFWHTNSTPCLVVPHLQWLPAKTKKQLSWKNTIPDFWLNAHTFSYDWKDTTYLFFSTHSRFSPGVILWKFFLTSETLHIRLSVLICTSIERQVYISIHMEIICLATDSHTIWSFLKFRVMLYSSL